MKVKIKRIRDEAIIPRYQTKGAACFDIHAVLNKDNPQYVDKKFISITETEKCEPYIVIPSMSQCIIPTGLIFQLPEGYYLDIRPRSGLAAKKCITITNSPGVLDFDFRSEKDELCIILFNLGKDNLIVKQGDRIAQCMVSPVERAEFEEITEEITDEPRGGFGSTKGFQNV